MHSSTTPSRPAILRRILNRGRAFGGALALVALMALLPAGSVLQANHDPSTPVVHSYSVNFTSTGQSQLGPFAALALDDASFEVFDESGDEADTGRYVWNTEIDYPGWVEDAFGVHDFNADFGGEITGSTSGRVQSEIGMRDFTTAAVDVTYPVNITLTTPEAESFIPGSTISIGSS